MDKITITVWTQHEAQAGMNAYAALAFKSEFSLDGHADHAGIAASHLVEYLPKMYAGDRISLRVDQPRRGRVESFCFLGKADGRNEHEEGDDSFTWEPTIARIARNLER
jgi:hypothetical protein